MRGEASVWRGERRSSGSKPPLCRGPREAALQGPRADVDTPQDALTDACGRTGRVWLGAQTQHGGDTGGPAVRAAVAGRC